MVFGLSLCVFMQETSMLVITLCLHFQIMPLMNLKTFATIHNLMKHIKYD